MQSLLFKSKSNFLSIYHYYCKRIHLIGIGGSGMCGIATILIQKGYYITGSDIINNNMIRYLLELGVKKIFLGHYAGNVYRASVVVKSSAIDEHNSEVQSAIQLNIPIIKRALVLSELMKYKYSIAISGTHGKSTTTAMLTNIYIESGLDPTFVNGEIIKSEGVRARLGHSHCLIAEADESDKSFLCLKPTVAVVTNIDYDHMHSYQKNFDNLKESFIKFLNNLPIYGYGIVCIDDIAIRQILFRINKKIITYGFSEDADVCILNYDQYRGKSYFTLKLKYNKTLQIILNTIGRHNVLNATAAIAIAIEEGVCASSILKAMFSFKGVNRRFENLGNYYLKSINGRNGNIILIDDYGHHPSEVDITIKTVRAGWPNKRLIMIFQPHRFTRTYDLYNDFVVVLSKVDILLILDIYSAGEKPISGVNGKSLCYSIYNYGKVKPIFIPNNRFLCMTLYRLLQDEDLILIQGAGTISNIVRSLFDNVPIS